MHADPVHHKDGCKLKKTFIAVIRINGIFLATSLLRASTAPFENFKHTSCELLSLF